MKIETKFKPGDDIIFLSENKITRGIISRVTIDLYASGETIIKYVTKTGRTVKEENAYASADELIESLSKQDRPWETK